MFDPDTVAFEFLGITIWHHDPCKDGTDDSCGWGKPKLTKQEIAFVANLIDNEFDNLRNFFGNQQIITVGDKSFFEDCSKDDMKRNIRIIIKNYKRFSRKWWQHPKWHFSHWRIQIRWKLFKFSFGRKLDNRSLMASIAALMRDTPFHTDQSELAERALSVP